MALPTYEEYLTSSPYFRGRIRQQYKAAGLPVPHAGLGRQGPYKGRHYPRDHVTHQPRPERWYYKDPVLRSQHHSFNKIRAQAHFRQEDWALTIDDFFELWRDRWHLRGRRADNLVMTRRDWDLPWCRANVEIITRYEHISRVAELRRGIPTKVR
jgi:hypothetical protein